MESGKTDEKQWLQLLQQDDEAAMQFIFNKYYKYLIVTAYNILGDDHKARDLVQDVFFEFWKKRGDLKHLNSIKAYLRRAVVNRTISEIRSRKRLVWGEDHPAIASTTTNASAQKQLEVEDLQNIINAAVESLPEKCRLVFSLSRFENLSHKEIAEQLGISVKTIENQITRALKVIRKATEQYGGKAGVAILMTILLEWLG